MDVTRQALCPALVPLAGLLPLACAAPAPAARPADAPAEGRARLEVAMETSMLPNGMTVVLLEDHALPRVVIDTWFSVGSKDEAPGRSGFAHLFEHLMFMGTERVPGNQFDVLMERGGGSNNASTSSDRTNYYSSGPAALLPTLLWLDADRLDALDDAMTQEKLDRQRDVVRNERRQSIENVPYGKEALLLPEALYPESHPYHHSVIGSHEDLEAATLEDVVGFFREFYVPANATLVIAGDFDPAAVKPLVARTFGALASRPAPVHRQATAPVLEREVRVVSSDRVEFPKLTLAWHSPAEFAPGDAELGILATVLAGGSSSRLERRLVLDTRLAQEVSASQQSSELGSVFTIEAVAAPGADLEAIKGEILAVVDQLVREGPDAAELQHARALQEARFLRRLESLFARAEAVQAYRHYWGVSDGFQRDLERRTGATSEDVRAVAARVLGEGRVDLRILPEVEASPGALDERPADFAARDFQPALPSEMRLANGIPLYFLPRPGTGLFSASLLVGGGELALPAARGGAALLLARWLESGAGGRDKAAFAQAVESLGATLRASADRGAMTFDASGLASRLPATLDLLRDLVRAPNLTAADFAREKEQHLNDIRARDQDAGAVARTVAQAALFGQDSPRGRPLEGRREELEALSPTDVKAERSRLLDPTRAAFVVVGDVDAQRLVAELEQRFGDWQGSGEPIPVAPEPLREPAPGRIVCVQREGAPQTVIQILRPISPAEGRERALRAAVDTVFGGTFTSRLNANLREDKGWTYGARSRITQDGQQFLLTAGAAVVTEHTGDALLEFKREFERMAASGIDAGELEKAVESNRARLIGTGETTAGLARALAELVSDGRPLDALRTEIEAMATLDLEAAVACARSGLYDWERCLVVLVGDRSAILEQLATAGFQAPLELDPLGRPLPDAGR